MVYLINFNTIVHKPYYAAHCRIYTGVRNIARANVLSDARHSTSASLLPAVAPPTPFPHHVMSPLKRPPEYLGHQGCTERHL